MPKAKELGQEWEAVVRRRVEPNTSVFGSNMWTPEMGSGFLEHHLWAKPLTEVITLDSHNIHDTMATHEDDHSEIQPTDVINLKAVWLNETQNRAQRQPVTAHDLGEGAVQDPRLNREHVLNVSPRWHRKPSTAAERGQEAFSANRPGARDARLSKCTRTHQLPDSLRITRRTAHYEVKSMKLTLLRSLEREPPCPLITRRNGPRKPRCTIQGRELSDVLGRRGRPTAPPPAIVIGGPAMIDGEVVRSPQVSCWNVPISQGPAKSLKSLLLLLCLSTSVSILQRLGLLLKPLHVSFPLFPVISDFGNLAYPLYPALDQWSPPPGSLPCSTLSTLTGGRLLRDFCSCLPLVNLADKKLPLP
uniref:Uncharacterized protein LOC123612321 n=1 Tax=Camelus bactrianus TaxID=9837 RepID=A0A9W3FJ30_CAMBA|nr:uncharacterized protein LOC123612321 [Camelus bactrianus]